MVRGRIASFGYAFAGLGLMLRTQPNAWIHCAATVVVIGAGAFVGLARSEWAMLVVAIALVWVTEAVNTALEFLADAAVPAKHPLIAHSKDIAAAAVLLASLAALLLGALVFIPHLG